MTSLLFFSLEIFLHYPCKEVNSEIGNSFNISNLKGNVCFFLIFFCFFSLSFLSVVSIIPLHLVIQNPQEKILTLTLTLTLTLKGNVCFFLIFFCFFSLSFLSVVSIIPLHLVIQNPQEKIFVFFFSVVFLCFRCYFFSCKLSVLFSLFLIEYMLHLHVLVVKRPSDRFRCFCLSGSLYLTDQRHRCIESDGCNAKRLPFNNSWKTGKARFVAFYSSCSMHQSAFFI